MTFAAVILAGGRSSRMGQNKAQMIRPDGLTQLEHTQRQVAKLNPASIMISGVDLPDIYPDCGPLSGIHAALETLETGDSLLVVPCDLPLLTVDALQPLLSETDSVAYQHAYLPCLLHVSIPLKTRINSILKNKENEKKSNFSIRNLLNFLNIHWIENTLEKELKSANTIQEWINLTKFIKNI